jgi:hypothetical protein
VRNRDVKEREGGIPSPRNIIGTPLKSKESKTRVKVKLFYKITLLTRASTARIVHGAMSALKYNFSKWFYGLLLIHFTVWSSFSILCQKDAPLDVMEAVVWGSQWQLGYQRDPYLTPWLSYIVSTLGGHALWPIYLFSQICIIVSFWAVWQLAKKMALPAVYGFIAVLLLEGIAYYNLTTPEFNDNVLQIPFWALTILSFYTALKNPKSKAFLAVGLFLALAFMSKYFAIFLFIPMTILMLGTSQGRRHFKNPFLYAGILIFLLIIMPNVIWLFHSHFLYVNYALSRVGDTGTWTAHFFSPLRFLFNQWAILLPALLAFSPFYFAARQKGVSHSFDRHFLLAMGAGPLFTALLYSVISGAHFHSMWGAPLFNLVGLLLVVMVHPVVSARSLKIFIGLSVFFFILFLLVYFVLTVGKPLILQRDTTAVFPGKAMTESLTQEWHQKFHTPLYYVSGSHEHSARVSFYSSDHPKPYFECDPLLNPWIDEKDFEKRGALFVWDTEGSYDLWVPIILKNRFPRAKILPHHHYHFQTSADIPPVELAVAFLPPRNA